MKTTALANTPNWLDKHHLGFANLITYAFIFHKSSEMQSAMVERHQSVRALSGLWPRPWLYSRVLIIFAISFFLLHICWLQEGADASSNLYPGMLVTGALAVPMTMLMFFYECNQFRNIPFLKVLYYMLMGSCISILITFILTYIFDWAVSYTVEVPRQTSSILPIRSSTLQLEPLLARHPMIELAVKAVIEEIGKVLVIFIFLRQYRRQCYVLTGMLIGAAVGAGFAVFESAGYASGSAELVSMILTRGVLSPGCHIAWGALIGSCTMLLCNPPLRYRFLINPKFIVLFILISGLHCLWNLSAYEGDYNRLVQLSLFTIFLVLMLIWVGVMQTRKFKAQGFIPISRR